MSRKRAVFRRAAEIAAIDNYRFSCHALQEACIKENVPFLTADRWKREWLALLDKYVVEVGGLRGKTLDHPTIGRGSSIPLCYHKQEDIDPVGLRVKLLSAMASGRLDRVRRLVHAGYDKVEQ